MKILMLNTFDEIGGAARAACRLLHGVRDLGIDAQLLVQSRTGNAPGTLCHPGRVRQLARRLKMVLGTLPVRMSPQAPLNNFTPALLPDHLVPEIAAVNPDIIHLHWMGAGFLRVETLAKLNRPLVWTLHDSWAFSGGCHVPFECSRYQQSCGACPVLGSTREQDLSRRVWARKAEAWRKLDLTLVAPSRWLADCARSSALFRDTRVEVIPNGLDTGLFRPRGRAAARKLLGLPQDRKIILFGAIRAADDPNKGLHLLLPALRSLGAPATDHMALVFSSFDKTVVPDAGMPVVALGRIEDDEKLAAVYSAADVFVAPSIQEAFCQTATEAMACGTPVVAFRATGLLDVVEHQKTGYLAKPYDIVDLAHGIAWVIEDAERHAALATQAPCRAAAEFSLDQVAQRYTRLYASVLKGQDIARTSNP
jgi:glycosyltransferase involved in cell wall biosynthesis